MLQAVSNCGLGVEEMVDVLVAFGVEVHERHEYLKIIHIFEAQSFQKVMLGFCANTSSFSKLS